MNLSQFIDQVGHKKISESLGVTTVAVLSWKHLKQVPRPTTAFELICISHGALTWASIYEPYVKKNLKGKSIKMTTVRGVEVEFKF